jgi:hypothetical protein
MIIPQVMMKCCLMKGTKKLLCFSNVLLMFSTTILFMVKAYRLIINFETQNKAYKEPFGYMDKTPKAEISYLNT